MPRFGAEGTNAALHEMMRQQLLKDLMLENAPVQEWRSKPFNLSRENQVNPLNEIFGRKNPGPYDPVYGFQPYDDTKTSDQDAREQQAFGENWRASRLQTIKPEQYNQPSSRSPFADMPMPPGMGISRMDELYQQMPEQGSPRYPMMEMPQGSPELQQLMQFYTNEDI